MDDAHTPRRKGHGRVQGQRTLGLVRWFTSLRKREEGLHWWNFGWRKERFRTQIHETLRHIARERK